MDYYVSVSSKVFITLQPDEHLDPVWNGEKIGGRSMRFWDKGWTRFRICSWK